MVGDGSGCVAMEQVFHVECFTCVACRGRLRGRPFYALDKKSYCEACYIVRATGAASGPRTPLPSAKLGPRRCLLRGNFGVF